MVEFIYREIDSTTPVDFILRKFEKNSRIIKLLI